MGKLDRLIRLRKEKGLSREDMAQMTGATYLYIYRCETGKMKPTLRAGLLMGIALGVEKLEDMYFLTEDE